MTEKQTEEPTNRTTKAAPRRLKFTDLGLQRLKPGDAQDVVWDTETKGLSLLISPGGTKTYRATFVLNKKTISVKIGRFNEIALTEARITTAEMRGKASRGDDPRRQPVSAATFGNVVDDFIRLYAQPKQRTWKQTEATLKGTCGPWLKRPINDITRSDAYKLFDGFIAEGRVYKAAVALAWCRKLWRWAWQREIVASPLMDGVRLDFERRERTRVYSDADIQAIWKAADQLDPARGAYIKLLLMLAPRKRELLRMKWSDIKSGIWTTPFADTKSKKTAKPRTYTTPLPALAKRILAGIPTRDKEDRVFPTMASRPEAPLISDLTKRGAPHFGFHVCRHTVATWLQNRGHSLYEVSLVLNHSGGGVTAGYSHGYPIDLKRKLLEEWASHIASIVRPAEGVMLLR